MYCVSYSSYTRIQTWMLERTRVTCSVLINTLAATVSAVCSRLWTACDVPDYFNTNESCGASGGGFWSNFSASDPDAGITCKVNIYNQSWFAVSFSFTPGVWTFWCMARVSINWPWLPNHRSIKPVPWDISFTIYLAKVYSSRSTNHMNL